MMTMASLACVFKAMTLWIVVQTCLASSKDDKITSLPGQPPVKFNQYAGYITVDDKEQRSLFYYFVEAETDPQTKPLVLWLSGGPGCSSVAGAFLGRGPFIPKGEILLRNNFSWNREANMLFVDSPAGVGFSYSSDKSFYNFTNDDITARDNLNFLFGWLDQYPEYKNRDFFISGVSYAGHYVPQLANLLMETTLNSNLKGIAIGNPFLDSDVNSNMTGDFLWSHGLISDSTYSMFNTVCSLSRIFRQTIDGNISSACLQVYNQVIEEMGTFIDPANVLINVCLPNSASQGDELDVCLDNEIAKYFNRKDVQEALHANLVGVNQWSECTEASDIGYDRKDKLVSTIPLLGKLVQGSVRVMAFCGDQDSAAPFMGTRLLVRALAQQLGLNSTTPYKSWLNNKQVGGWIQVYGDVLSFATVRGGGHDSAVSQPERTHALFKTFLEGKPLP